MIYMNISRYESSADLRYLRSGVRCCAVVWHEHIEHKFCAQIREVPYVSTIFMHLVLVRMFVCSPTQHLNGLCMLCLADQL